MCFHVQIKLLRVTVSSAQVRSVPATTVPHVQNTPYTVQDLSLLNFQKCYEMDGWVDGCMDG